MNYFHETDNSLVSYKTISSGEKSGYMTARVRTGEEFRTRSGFTGFTYEVGPSQDLVLPLWTGRIPIPQCHIIINKSFLNHLICTSVAYV